MIFDITFAKISFLENLGIHDLSDWQFFRVTWLICQMLFSGFLQENQKDLENATEILSEYLERDITRDSIADIKQKVQDKSRLVLLKNVFSFLTHKWNMILLKNGWIDRFCLILFIFRALWQDSWIIINILSNEKSETCTSPWGGGVGGVSDMYKTARGGWLLYQAKQPLTPVREDEWLVAYTSHQVTPNLQLPPIFGILSPLWRTISDGKVDFLTWMWNRH